MLKISFLIALLGFSISAAAETVRLGDRWYDIVLPANPQGAVASADYWADLLALARRLAGRCLVVVDEAYGEYSDQPSVAGFINEQPNLAVLRTLSKAHALAAARIGCLLAAPELVAVLRNCQAPYPLPSPCVQLALAGLSDQALALTRQHVQAVRAERERLRAELVGCPGVRRVYPSQGNYLLVRFEDAGLAFARLLAAGVVVRDMRASPQLADALRISIGKAEENDAVLAALRVDHAVLLQLQHDEFEELSRDIALVRQLDDLDRNPRRPLGQNEQRLQCVFCFLGEHLFPDRITGQ